MGNDITMNGLHAVQNDCIKAVKREVLEQKSPKRRIYFPFSISLPHFFFPLLFLYIYIYNLKYNMKIFALSAIVATVLATVSEAAVSR
jgi:hypothetical protein